MDAIERVEVSVRSRLINCFSLKYGAFGYLSPENLPKLSLEHYNKLLSKICLEKNRSNETFVKHYKGKYVDENELPLWMAGELMDFGSMFTLFRGVESSIKQQTAKDYDVSDKVLNSWLISLNTVRNVCAHHGRLWNRVVGNPVMIPNKDLQWHVPVELTQQNDRVFAILSVLRYLLLIIAPQSHWYERLVTLLEVKHPNIPLKDMGFPDDWENCPIWKNNL